MPTTADSSALRKQADALREAAKALEPKLGDAAIDAADRMQLFAQFQALHSQAFALTTKAAENILTDLSVEVAELQGAIDKGAKALSNIKRVKDVIDIATSLVQVGAAIATGQPAGIAQAFGGLQDQITQARHRPHPGG